MLSSRSPSLVHRRIGETTLLVSIVRLIEKTSADRYGRVHHAAQHMDLVSTTQSQPGSPANIILSSEVNVIIIAACVPTLNPLFVTWSQKRRQSRRSTNYSLEEGSSRKSASKRYLKRSDASSTGGENLPKNVHRDSAGTEDTISILKPEATLEHF